MPITRQGSLRQQQSDDGDVTITPSEEDNACAGEPGRVNEPAGAAATRPAQSPVFQPPSELFLSSLMDSITRAQAEANRNLINSLMMPGSDFRSSTPAMPYASTTCAGTSAIPTSSGVSGGNFTRCTARFNGSKHDAEALEAFIDAVEVFKECAAVSDEHALRGLPMLLEGEAAVWWRGVRSSVTTWQDALSRLRGIYGVRQPSYKIFRQIFAAEQRNDERAEVFLCKLRALIAKLPYKLDEVIQIDMCYGLLHRRVRKRVPRQSIESFDMLLCETRVAEDTLKEFKEVAPLVFSNNRDSSQSIPIPKGPTIGSNLTRSSSPTMSANTAAAATRNSNKHKDRPRCTFCRAFGHISIDCRQREKASNNNISTSKNVESGNSNKNIRCYGCGKQNVVRSKCDVCNAGTSTSKKGETGVAFNSVAISTTDLDEVFTSSDDDSVDFDISALYEHSPCTIAYESVSHPMVNINIMGHDGVAIVDTGATHCIASPTLYKLLVDAGFDA